MYKSNLGQRRCERLTPFRVSNRPEHFIRDTTHQSLGLFSKLALGATPCCSEYVIPVKMLLIPGEKMLLICGDASTQKLYWELAAVKRLSAFSLLRTQECF